MPGLNHPPYLLPIVAIAILAASSWNARGQTPDAKPKGTGSISGHVTLGDKPAPAVMVAAFADNTNHGPTNPNSGFVTTGPNQTGFRAALSSLQGSRKGQERNSITALPASRRLRNTLSTSGE